MKKQHLNLDPRKLIQNDNHPQHPANSSYDPRTPNSYSNSKESHTRPVIKENANPTQNRYVLKAGMQQLPPNPNLNYMHNEYEVPKSATPTAGQQQQEYGSTPSKYFQAPGRGKSAKNGNHDSDMSERSRGIGVTSKLKRRETDEQQSGISYQQEEKPKTLGTSQSEGRLIHNNPLSQNNKNNKAPNHPYFNNNDGQLYGFQQQIQDYKHLHEKLNTLENKILIMKNNLEKKKEDKKKFLEAQIQQRKHREEEFRKEKQRREEREKEQQQAMIVKKKETVKKENIENISVAQPAATTTTSPANSDLLKNLVTQVQQHKEYKYVDFNPYSPRNNIYYVSEILKAYRDERSIARQHISYSISILKMLQNSKRMNETELAQKMVNLPQKQYYRDKKTVVFDLDQTLIHCNQNISLPYDVKLPVKFPTGELIEAGINIRPYAFEIIKNLAQNFEVIVFTASHSCYANVVLDHLDPERKYIQHRLYRQHCHATTEGVYVKDLRIINRKLENLVLVDNAAYSYAFQLDNGIPIIPYYQGKTDFELCALQKYLQGMLFVRDVREVNRKTFKLDQYRRFDDPEKLVRELYENMR